MAEKFTEVFPINTETLPVLYGYKLIINSKSLTEVGRNLPYPLKESFGGQWSWSSDIHRMIGDKSLTEAELQEMLEKLWQSKPDKFRDLQRLEPDPEFQPTAQAKADFVAYALFKNVDRDIKSILSNSIENINGLTVKRIHQVKPWVVNGEPAISISVQSEVLYNRDLKSYAAQFTDANRLIGLMVKDKNSDLKGTIVSIVGSLVSHRTRLLSLAKKEPTRVLITDAPDHEWVVSVATRSGNYDYAISALRIIVRLGDCQRLGLAPQKVIEALRIAPTKRSDLIKDISGIPKQKNWIKLAYASNRSPDVFQDSDSLGFNSDLCFGNQQTGDHAAMLANLKQHGFYRQRPQFAEGKPIYIAILKGTNTDTLQNFRPKLEQELKAFKFTVEYVGLQNIEHNSRSAIEEGINILMAKPKQPDIIVGFFRSDTTEPGTYDNFKSLTIGRGIPSQYINTATIGKNYAFGNIALGILGKTGNTPFTLASPLPYADLVIGLDVARQQKKNLAGSVNATAVARVYAQNGDLIRYRLHDAPIEGETIPPQVLQSLFPIDEFTGKRVVIHRDGLFRGNEKKTLKSWAQQINAQFYLVEVIKDAVPRIYTLQDSTTYDPATQTDKTKKTVTSPQKGDVFKLSETQAFLISSLAVAKEDSTPQPLQVRTEAPFTIEQAVHSVLSLTLLHYGSLRGTRSPVSIHFSDKIGFLALKGIKPKELTGAIPYWL
ncbi:MAG: Piwi domain-containing protein [Pseudanabaena sp. ELA607]